ncbi:MAG: ABC transporter substrate-binding protein [Bifidobacterium sp.]|nr:ABC transporter substrate-binding protein [Bifidobacterium sp.]
MKKHSRILASTAFVAAAALSLSACGGTSSSEAASANADTDAFVVGALFPETGSLAFLGAPEIAAVKLAVADVNAAGGVLGKDVTEVSADVSDAEHADQNTSGAQSVLSKHPSVMIGPASSGVVKNTYKSIAAQKVPLISMGSTSTAFSGLDPYFFRTVAPDSVQGAVMGDLIAQDGVDRLAILVFNDEYGTGLRDTVAERVKAAGVDIVYGETETFDPTETNFASVATAVKESKPDATLVITYDQAKPLIKALSTAGVDTHKLYLVDGNANNYSDDFDAGLLEGSKATIPGVNVTDEFHKQLEANGLKTSDPTTYAAETYDAVILAALAAEKGGAADGETVQQNLMAVSGASGGEKCESYKACKALLDEKKDIRYVGQTGIGPFNDDHDPSTANIGIYQYQKDNTYKFVTQQEGEV